MIYIVITHTEKSVQVYIDTPPIGEHKP